MKRKKLIKQELEKRLAKLERRIQNLADNAYEVRVLLDTLNQTEKVLKGAEQIEGGLINVQ